MGANLALNRHSSNLRGSGFGEYHLGAKSIKKRTFGIKI
jgi:hypothetical protein